MATKPIGTGPFKAEPGPGNTVVFTRFDDYFAESPKGKAGVKRDKTLFLAWDFTVASERNLTERRKSGLCLYGCGC